MDIEAACLCSAEHVHLDMVQRGIIRLERSIMLMLLSNQSTCGSDSSYLAPNVEFRRSRVSIDIWCSLWEEQRRSPEQLLTWVIPLLRNKWRFYPDVIWTVTPQLLSAAPGLCSKLAPCLRGWARSGPSPAANPRCERARARWRTSALWSPRSPGGSRQRHS